MPEGPERWGAIFQPSPQGRPSPLATNPNSTRFVLGRVLQGVSQASGIEFLHTEHEHPAATVYRVLSLDRELVKYLFSSDSCLLGPQVKRPALRFFTGAEHTIRDSRFDVLG